MNLKSGEVLHDSDLRNLELVFDRHHEDPFEVLRIRAHNEAPAISRGNVCSSFVQCNIV